MGELALDNLPTLDDQEGVANEVYHRFTVQVTACTSIMTHEEKSYLDHAGHSVEAFTYQLTPKRLALSPSEAGCSDASKWRKPSRAYKTVIGRGAREHRLPSSYIDSLDTIEDNGFEGHVNLESRLVGTTPPRDTGQAK